MTKPKKQSRKTGRKIISLSVNPALIETLDGYAAEQNLSRSAAMEAAIVRLTAPTPAVPTTVSVNSPSDGGLFASPQIGQAIRY